VYRFIKLSGTRLLLIEARFEFLDKALGDCPLIKQSKRSFVIYSNYEETDSRGWLVALLTCTGIMYGVSIAAVVLMYIYYTGEYVGQCKLHEFFISINLVKTSSSLYQYTDRNRVDICSAKQLDNVVVNWSETLVF
jgi:hypothetical protein